jgi:hypothetical protein
MGVSDVAVVGVQAGSPPGVRFCLTYIIYYFVRK